MEFDIDKKSAEIGIPDEDDKFAIVLVDLAAKRRSTYHLFNIMLPVFLITSCCTTVIAIPANTDDGAGSRLAITLTLLLTTVAYKITAADSLPQLGYLTYLDLFIITNFCFLVLVAFENLFIALAKEHNWNDDGDCTGDDDRTLTGNV